MKYCSECGIKLDVKDKNLENIKPVKKSNKRGFTISAGVMIIIAASLCFVLGASALITAMDTSTPEYYYEWDHYNNYSYNWAQFEMNLFIAVVSLSAVTTGLISGLLIFKKTAFTLALIGLINVNIAAMLSIGNNIGMFFAVGLPVFVLSIIAMIFTIHSKDTFN